MEKSQHNDKLYAARDTGQIIVEGDNLRIGVGNLSEEPYDDEDGISQLGPTAGLWLFLRGHPELDKHVRVHQGKVFDFGGYTIRVAEIDLADGYVFLGISGPDQQ